MYTIQKNYNRIQNGQPTFFLDPKEQLQLKSKLRKGEYQIFLPFKDSEKAIFYTSKKPDVILYEIKIKQPLKHQDILGSVFALNITDEMFGDIVIQEDRYYIYVLSSLRNFFEASFTEIKNSPIELIPHDLKYLADLERAYSDEEYIVSSERIDTIIARIIHTNRDAVKTKIQKKEIMLNHDFLSSSCYVLKQGDVFSIRKYGKYKYAGIIKKTRKEHFLVHILKYI